MLKCVIRIGRSPVAGISVLVLLGLLAGLPVPDARAASSIQQVVPETSVAQDSVRPVVRDVRVLGNKHFSERTLERHIRTRRNRRILGVPGFTWWRWMYQLGDAGWMWGRLGNALKSGGEPPAYLDSTTVAGDIERLTLFYEQQGFREAAVSAQVQPRRSAERVSVVFRVDPGPPTYLRRVQYEGLSGLSASQKRTLARGTVLNAERHDPETPLSFRADDQRFQKPLLLEERRRLLSFLKDVGYAAISRDSIRAIVYPHQTSSDSLDVTLQVKTGPKYRFGDVEFRIQGPEQAAAWRDTIDVPGASGIGYQPIVTSVIENETQLGTGLLRRSLQFTPGTMYERSRVVDTKQRLEGTGIFTLTSLSPQFGEATVVDSTRYLPLRVEGQTRQRHRLRMETFGLQRGSEVGLGTSEFGVGVSGVYENVNAFGGGETVSIRTSGSVATSLDSTLITSRQLEGTVSLTLPYLVRPFGGFENIFDLTNSRTRLSVSALTARRNDLRLLIRSRTSARFRLEMDHTPTQSSLVDVFDLSISNPDTLSGFRTRFLDSLFVRVQDPVQQAQILQDYTQPQINTAIRYTFRSATANPLRRRRGHIYEVSGEVGNTIPFLLDRFLFAPDTLEYSVPGLTGRSGGGLSGRLRYRPYVRGTVDLRRYMALGPGSTLAMKVFGGIAHPTGGPTLVPFDRRFFSGGASSVRGWRLRQLGPGGAVQRNDFVGGDLLGGDLKLESSVEVRTRLLQNVLAANWVGATFLDVGNVWFGPRNQGFQNAERRDAVSQDRPPTLSNPLERSGRFDGLEDLGEVGVGAGLGIRIEWEYLIARFDLAYRLHDPSPENDDVFSDNFQGPLLHFGIGQAF